MGRELGGHQTDLAKLEIALRNLETTWLFMRRGDGSLVAGGGNDSLASEVQMRIIEVLKGGPNAKWPTGCTALGVPDSNAWCMHATWLGYTPVPGPICDTCQDFGVEAIGLRG